MEIRVLPKAVAATVAPGKSSGLNSSSPGANESANSRSRGSIGSRPNRRPRVGPIHGAFRFGALTRSSRIPGGRNPMFRSIWTFSVSLMVGAVLVASPAASEPQYSRAQGVFPPLMTTTTRVCVASAGTRIGGRRNANAAMRVGTKPTIASAGATDRRTIGVTTIENGTNGPVASATSGWGIAFSGRRTANAPDPAGRGRPTRRAASMADFIRISAAIKATEDTAMTADGWQGGDQNERVCCSRNGQVWWSTRAECRRAWGYPATNKTCRRN